MIQGEVVARRHHQGHFTAVHRDPRERSGVVAVIQTSHTACSDMTLSTGAVARIRFPQSRCWEFRQLHRQPTLRVCRYPLSSASLPPRRTGSSPAVRPSSVASQSTPCATPSERARGGSGWLRACMRHSPVLCRNATWSGPLCCMQVQKQWSVVQWRAVLMACDMRRPTADCCCWYPDTFNGHQYRSPRSAAR
jgi:hypothetical protein